MTETKRAPWHFKMPTLRCLHQSSHMMATNNSCTPPEQSSESRGILDSSQILSLICINVLYCNTEELKDTSCYTKRQECNRPENSQKTWMLKRMWREAKHNRPDLPSSWTHFDFFWKENSFIEYHIYRSSLDLRKMWNIDVKQTTVRGYTTWETFRSSSLKAWFAATFKFQSVPMLVKHQRGR